MNTDLEFPVPKLRASRWRGLRVVVMSKCQNPFSRLSDWLDPEQRSVLRQLMLIRLLAEIALFYRRIGTDVDYRMWTEVASTPYPESDPAPLKVMRALGVNQFLQASGHLGKKMAAALTPSPLVRRSMPSGQILLGLDTPNLGVRELTACAKKLQDYPWVFVPAKDGGFCLCATAVGNRKHPRPTTPRRAFAQSHWSHSEVLSQVCGQLQSEEYALLPAMSDIDSIADYRQAIDDGRIAKALLFALTILRDLDSGRQISDCLAGVDSDEGADRYALADVIADTKDPTIKRVLLRMCNHLC